VGTALVQLAEDEQPHGLIDLRDDFESTSGGRLPDQFDQYTF